MQKKILKNFLILIFIFFFGNKTFAAKGDGSGELKLSPMVVDYFIQYIRGEQFKFPAAFFVTLDGSDAVYWYCSEMTNCQSGSIVQDLATCLRVTGKECSRFARMRLIKWKNEINPGKGKISRINSKWTDGEIRSHLKELGFID